MRGSLVDRLLGNRIATVAAGGALIASLIGFLNYDTPGWWLVAAGAAAWRVSVAEKRLRDDRNWSEAKRPSLFRRSRFSRTDKPNVPARRPILLRPMLALGSKRIAWPLLISAAAAFGYGTLIAMPSDRIHGLDFAMLCVLMMTGLARAYRRRQDSARSQPGVGAASSLKGEMIVHCTLPALPPPPSVREAMQRLSPELTQLIYEGVMAEDARQRVS